MENNTEKKECPVCLAENSIKENKIIYEDSISTHKQCENCGVEFS